MKYRTKPFEIYAVQFTGSNWRELEEFCGTRTTGHGEVPNFAVAGTYVNWEDPEIEAEVYVSTSQHWAGLRQYDYVILGNKGQRYPCDLETFEAKYERVGLQPINYIHQKVYIVGGPLNGRIIEPKRHAGAVMIEDGRVYERTERFHMGFHVYQYMGARAV